MSDQPLTMPAELIGETADGLERFDRAEPDAHFALPKRISVDLQLEYWSRYAETRGLPLFKRQWQAAVLLISAWECAALPDLKIDLKKIDNPQAATVIMWAGNAVLQYVQDLETLPKV